MNSRRSTHRLRKNWDENPHRKELTWASSRTSRSQIKNSDEDRRWNEDICTHDRRRTISKTSKITKTCYSTWTTSTRSSKKSSAQISTTQSTTTSTPTGACNGRTTENRNSSTADHRSNRSTTRTRQAKHSHHTITVRKHQSAATGFGESYIQETTDADEGMSGDDDETENEGNW